MMNWRQSHVCYICLLVVGSLVFSCASIGTSWWQLGVSGCSIRGPPDCPDCSLLNLTTAQIEICERGEDGHSSVEAISVGARRSIIDCQSRFSTWRWNCSTFFGEHLFGSFIDLSTRETAILYAYLTAGATYGIATACHDQQIDCFCNVTGPDQETDEDSNLIFNDCNDNVEYAVDFIDEFLSVSTGGPVTDRDIMDEHNTAVGKEVVKDRTRTCVCHGLSGTCTVQTCYFKVPEISEVGGNLRIKYDSAVKVHLDNSSGYLELVPTQTQDAPTVDDLVYTGSRLTFCDPVPAMGILGTEGRMCDPDSSGSDGCDILCCGRGYRTTTYNIDTEVCRFVWCCEIKCERTGSEVVMEHRCN